MAEHTINSRILLRYDTLSNWQTSQVILKLGEAAVAVAVYDNTIDGTDHQPSNTPPAVGIKIGDGYHSFNFLPWVLGVAGDVYNWAKLPNPPSAANIPGLSNYIANYIENNYDIPSGGGGGDVPPTVEARTYRLIAGTGTNSNKYYLLSKGANDDDWITDESHYIDLTELANIVDWLGSARDFWSLTGFTLYNINELIGTLNYTDTPDATKIITAVNESNGIIRVSRGLLNPSAINGSIDVEHGGTGRSSLDADSVLVGNGTGAVSLRPIEVELLNNNNLATNRAIKYYIDNATAGLARAMHYIDEATVKIVNGSTTNPNIDNYNFNTALPGDVITYNYQEFVWTGSFWRLLGDERSYAIKGSIVDADIAEDANIALSKIFNLTENLNTLTSNLNNLTAILNTKVDKEDGKGLSTNDYTTIDKDKLAGIEAQAQKNLIEHIFINNEELYPTSINGQENSISISALDRNLAEKLTNIEPYAQVNLIEHIFINNNTTEETPQVYLGLVKSIRINSITNAERNKLAEIENKALVNLVESIMIDGITYDPDPLTKKITIAGLNRIAGATVPNGISIEDVSVVNNKLLLARIAKTGNVTDLLLTQNTYITLDCGSSIEII